MEFSIAATMPPPLLEIRGDLWRQLLEHLRRQGAGTRESGAFLLGRIGSSGRVATAFVPYEQLQADALQEDYVSLTAASFAKLWDFCRREELSVVADVHTHRYGPGQSASDSTNPMIALAGHIAIIVPGFAQGDVQLDELGVYIYEGSHQWTAFRGVSVIRCAPVLEQGDTT